MLENPIDTNARLLYQLLSGLSVSASKINSRATKELFEHLQQTGIIKKQRKGAGNQFQVMQPAALQNFVEQKYPSGLCAEPMPDVPSRTQGVLQSRDSKAQKKLDFSLLTVRGVTTLKHAGKTHSLNTLTDTDTSLCFKISPLLLCELPAPPCTIVTVENPTAFVELEKMPALSWQLAVYTAGKMSNILLQQLQCWHQQKHQLVHFGDYDYVGLLEFARILACCSTARLYYPDSLSEQLQQYGNARLLQDQVEQHKALLKKIKQLPDSQGKRELSEVHRLLQTSAKGLEQEGLYIP